MMKTFVFLYPIPEYIDFEIDRGANKNRESSDVFRARYKKMLNACIATRYRQNGFFVKYVMFDNHQISDLIEIQKGDDIIRTELDFKTHTTKRKDGTFPYPDNNLILQRLEPATTLRIGGFHMWDCVDKFAKRAYERGIDTLVDEDLTEFLTYQINNKKFRIDKYPNVDRDKFGGDMWEEFIRVRQSRPWMWQEYGKAG